LNIEEFRLTNSAIVDANAILKMSSLRQVDLRGTLLGDSDVAELKNKIESANLAIEFVGTGVVTQE